MYSLSLAFVPCQNDPRDNKLCVKDLTTSDFSDTSGQNDPRDNKLCVKDLTTSDFSRTDDHPMLGRGEVRKRSRTVSAPSLKRFTEDVGCEGASGVEPLTYRTAADCSATELYPRRNRLQRICLDSSGFHLVFESVFLSKYYISLSSLTKREAITGGLCEVLEALEACLLH
uniref:Uncharacterized protein n=2 Tax=Physcomitrium patens TaxID=3218 RepID=A0A2K1JCR6_PHYPA|nr:hypothetical protein PHYPA_019603 [Physcomitrium patens]